MQLSYLQYQWGPAMASEGPIPASCLCHLGSFSRYSKWQIIWVTVYEARRVYFFIKFFLFSPSSVANCTLYPVPLPLLLFRMNRIRPQPSAVRADLTIWRATLQAESSPSRACDSEAPGGAVCTLWSSLPSLSPLTRRGEPITPLPGEPAKLGSWQGQDSKPRLLGV